MIGCPLDWAWAVACWAGEVSQHPMWPHSAQRRRWSHQPDVASHSTQPVPLGGTETSIPFWSSTWSSPMNSTRIRMPILYARRASDGRKVLRGVSWRQTLMGGIRANDPGRFQEPSALAEWAPKIAQQQFALISDLVSRLAALTVTTLTSRWKCVLVHIVHLNKVKRAGS